MHKICVTLQIEILIDLWWNIAGRPHRIPTLQEVKSKGLK